MAPSTTGPSSSSALLRQGEARLRARRSARRRRVLALLGSLAIHLSLAALVVGLPGLLCTPERERVGSNELDIELVAPRLAPPIEPWGRSRDRPGRARAESASAQGRKLGQRDARQDRRTPRGRRDARRPSEEWTTPRDSLERRAQREQDQREQQHERNKEHSAREQKLREQAEQTTQQQEKRKPAQATAPRRARAEREARERRRRLDEQLLTGMTRPVEDEPQLARLTPDESSESALLNPTMPAEQAPAVAAEPVSEALPEGPSPSAVLNAVKRQAALRKRHQRQAMAAARRRFADAERRFAALSGRTARCSAGSFEATAVGRGGRDAQGRRDQLGGRAPRYGLKFYLSGRRVRTSKVVRPPELINMPRVQCKVTSLTVTPATVRMLVETDGKVGHLYLKHSSGSKRFDRCALTHARKMRFHPGTDEAGTPLNVWINLRVEPGLMTTAGL